MSFEQEKMIVGSLPSLYPLQKFEEEAISALVSLPIDDDAISRKAAIKALDKRFDSIPMEQTTEILLLRRDLRELPPTNTSEFPNSSDTISRQAAIDALDEIESEIAEGYGFEYEKWRKYFCDLPHGRFEPLTDKEQRIFLAAMERERKVCKEVDDQYTHEPYEVLLTKVCDEIKRKVKGALWS